MRNKVRARSRRSNRASQLAKAVSVRSLGETFSFLIASSHRGA